MKQSRVISFFGFGLTIKALRGFIFLPEKGGEVCAFPDVYGF